jgi:hypothetical protein
MELQVRKTADIVCLQAALGDIESYFCDGFQIGNKLYYSLDKLSEEYPDIISSLADGSKTIFLEIDIDTGEVTNWPKNCPTDFYDIKIVDTGHYWLVNDNADVVTDYSGYVPSCLGEGGYGDYLEFEIDENSHIVDWSFDQEDYDEFEENA